MGFNASFGKPAWCLGNVLMSIMSPWVAAGIKSGYEGRQDLSFASHSSAAPDFHAFEGRDTKVFPVGSWCDVPEGLRHHQGLAVVQWPLQNEGWRAIYPHPTGFQPPVSLDSPVGWHRTGKGGEQTFWDRPCRARARGQQGPALGTPGAASGNTSTALAPVPCPGGDEGRLQITSCSSS